ncbi:MAG TPA: YidC/Oxa1 family membrane protein insertase [Oscillospiraceae bacterium]|nr:YidC/Oxa1 family membrane protein insertase [Oscillospiraceae bacterium]
MQALFSFIGIPFGWIMWALYSVVKNYGVALIFFTLATKVILLPLAVRQQKQTAKTALFTPKLEALKKKYGSDKNRYQEEMMKLYQSEGVNPMGSCLPLLIQMPLIFGIIDVVYKPLTHIGRFGKETINSLISVANEIGATLTNFTAINGNDYHAQIKAMNIFTNNPDMFNELGAQQIDSFSSIAEKISTINLNFLGLNLGDIPTWSINLLFIIPIFSGVTAILSSILTQKINAKNNPAQAQIQGGMKAMIYLMPLMSFFFAVNLPAGVGFYWGFSNLFSLAQVYFLAKIFTPEKLKEMAQRDVDKKRLQNGTKPYTIETGATEVKDDDGVAKPKLSQKELDRRRLAQARRLDAEKYGEEYVEVKDEDLR